VLDDSSTLGFDGDAHLADAAVYKLEGGGVTHALIQLRAADQVGKQYSAFLSGRSGFRHLDVDSFSRVILAEFVTFSAGLKVTNFPPPVLPPVGLLVWMGGLRNLLVFP
jgi:hypothetical protein